MAVSRKIRSQDCKSVMRERAGEQCPRGMIEAGAVQKHDARQRGIEIASAGADETVDAVHNDTHGSGPLRGAQRLREILDDVACGLEANRDANELLADACGSERGCIHLLMRG